MSTYVNFNYLATRKERVYYEIGWSSNRKEPDLAWLCVGDRMNCVDITTGFYRKELILLCCCFRNLGLWSQEVDCWIEVGRSPGHVDNVQSSKRKLRLPVRPFDGLLTTRTLTAQPTPLTYTGIAIGRFFDFERLDGMGYYFVYNRSLETDPLMRGFDCTTFPMSLFQLSCEVQTFEPNINLPAQHVASALGAAKVGIEDKPRDKMFELLFGLSPQGEVIGQPRKGLYLLWRANAEGGGHIMLYKGEPGRYGIHEFTGSGSKGADWKSVGYAETAVHRRLPKFPLGQYWARQIPQAREWQVVNTVRSDAPGGDFPDPIDPRGVSTQPVGSGTPSSIGGSNGAPKGGTPYTVVSGDSLSKITGKFWGDVLLWPLLYDANRQVVGPDPNKIYPGQKLTVPSKSSYSSQQLSDARRRGTSC